MIINRQDLIEQREQAQEDVISILDGLDNEFVDRVCQVIVDRFGILLNKIKV